MLFWINRKIMGATDPKKAEENTIRKLLWYYQLIKTPYMDPILLIMQKKR